MLTNIAIEAAPQTEDQSFVDNLVKTQRFMRGEEENPQMDRQGFENLKKQMSGSKSVKVKGYN